MSQMKKLKVYWFLFATVLVFANALSMVRADFVPWDALMGDSWIETATSPTQLFTANGTAYDLRLGQAKSNGAARAMNSMTFSDGIINIGHINSIEQSGSFYIDNTGGQDYTNLVLMVAMETDILPGDFALSLNVRSQDYNFSTIDDFVYYNHPEYDAGRPSGYYSATDPAADQIAYDFESGMLSIMDLTCVSPANPLPGGGSLLEINYSFENLPARAVFSAYAAQFSSTELTHTNRALVDNNDPIANISTFEVIPEPSSLLILALGSSVLLRRK